MPKQYDIDNIPGTPIMIGTVCMAVINEPIKSTFPETPALNTIRRDMTLRDMNLFIMESQVRCKNAYKARARWIMDIINDKGDQGRDQFYVWVRHWFAGFLNRKRQTGSFTPEGNEYANQN